MEGPVSLPPAFVSYSRADSEFALRLVKDLTAAGAAVWLDQVDLAAGQRWDRAIEVALARCGCILVILSTAAVASENVMDEISFAIEERKEIIPVLYSECVVPFRLRRFQNIDFRSDYERGLERLVKSLGLVRKQADPIDDGAVVDRTEKKLEKRLEVAQELDEPIGGDAMADRGDMYFFGKGVPQDYRKAREWYEKGADAGSARAMYCLGNMYDHALSYFGDECDWNTARSWYEKSAAAGYADAMAMVGWHYDRGFSGDVNPVKALYWYQKAANAGSGHAMAGLGELYEMGKGVGKDATKAQWWYEKGADAGSGEAMARLGNLYFSRARDAHLAAKDAPDAVRGNIKTDYTKARFWLEKAVEAGACNVDAVADLATLDGGGFDREKNEQREAMWWEMYSTICNCSPDKPRRLIMIRYM